MTSTTRGLWALGFRQVMMKRIDNNEDEDDDDFNFSWGVGFPDPWGYKYIYYTPTYPHTHIIYLSLIHSPP